MQGMISYEASLSDASNIGKANIDCDTMTEIEEAVRHFATVTGKVAEFVSHNQEWGFIVCHESDFHTERFWVLVGNYKFTAQRGELIDSGVAR